MHAVLYQLLATLIYTGNGAIQDVYLKYKITTLDITKNRFTEDQ
jgi:hypothetical protein